MILKRRYIDCFVFKNEYWSYGYFFLNVAVAGFGHAVVRWEAYGLVPEDYAGC